MHHAIESLRLRAIPHAVGAARAEQRIQAMRAMPAMVHGSVELERVDDRLIAVRVRELQAHHFGGFSGTRQVVNGAVLAGLFDCAFGVAARLQYDSGATVTVDLSMQYMQATHGPHVTVYGAVVLSRARLAFSEAIVIDGRGELTARGTCTCTAVYREAADDRAR